MNNAIDLRTKWGQLGSAINALLAHRGIRVSPSELRRLDNAVEVRTPVIEIDVAAACGSDVTVDIAIRYMRHAVAGQSHLTSGGAATYTEIDNLIDQCEAAAKLAETNVEGQRENERLDDDGGRSAVEADAK
jgi:hypothetical protein